MSEIHRRAPLADLQMLPFPFRLGERQDVYQAPALVLVVVARHSSGLRGHGDACLGHHLVGRLVDGALRIRDQASVT
jgi:hypothetical protein